MLTEIDKIKHLFNLFGIDFPIEPQEEVKIPVLKALMREISAADDELWSSFQGDRTTTNYSTFVDHPSALCAITKQVQSLLKLAVFLGLGNPIISAFTELYNSQMTRFWNMDQIIRHKKDHYQRFEPRPGLFVVISPLGEIVDPPTCVPFDKTVCSDILLEQPE